jgi:hypothetical protein
MIYPEFYQKFMIKSGNLQPELSYYWMNSNSEV